MPRRRRDWLYRSFRPLFGDLAPLARVIFYHTTTFILLAGCFYVVRYVVGKLFEATDEVAGFLHIIDTYGILLLLAGFVIWTFIDVVIAVRRHINGEDDDEEDDEDH